LTDRREGGWEGRERDIKAEKERERLRKTEKQRNK
jgi:hypothetical protein